MTNLLLIFLMNTATAASFTYTDPNCASFTTHTGPAANELTITCAATTPPSTTTPPVCSPTVATLPSPVTAAGGNANLFSNCTASTVITYKWTQLAPISTAGGPPDPNAANATAVLAANNSYSAVIYTWQVVACTSATTCDTKTVSTTVPPLAGTDVISCPGFPEGTLVIDLPWVNASLLTQNFGGGFRGQGAMVLRFTVPAGTSPTSVAGQLRMNEYADPAAARYAVFSTKACDFSGQYGASLPALATGISINFSMAVTTAQYGQIKLLPGTTYFVNVRNTNTAGGASCFHPTCNMVINWFIPRAAAASAASKSAAVKRKSK